MYEITDEVPIPDRTTPRNNKYDLHKMGIGDSFSLPYDGEAVQRVRVAVSNYGTRNDKKFTTRKLVVDSGEPVFRVWRVA